MGKENLLQKISEASTIIMPWESYQAAGFAYPVSSERLLLRREEGGISIGSVLANVGTDTDAKFYSVFNNSFYDARSSTEPTYMFKCPVHDHIVYSQDSLTALSREDNQTVLNLEGNQVEEFKYKVHPQILSMSDGSYIALKSDNQGVLSTDNKVTFPAFKEPVFPTIIRLGGDKFASIRKESPMFDVSTVISNGVNMDTLGQFPFVNENPSSIGGSNGRFVKIGKRFAGLDKHDKQLIIHTIQGDERPVHCGRFPYDMDPGTLTIDEHAFVAADDMSRTRVYTLSIGKISHPIEEKGIDTSNHDLIISRKDLSRILSEDN